MYKTVYVSPKTHVKLVVLKDLGEIKSINGFVEMAVNQAIQGIQNNNRGEKKQMKIKKREHWSDYDLEKVKHTNRELYFWLLDQRDYEYYTARGYKPVYGEYGEILEWVRKVQ